MTDFAQPAEIRPSRSSASTRPPAGTQLVGEWLEAKRGFVARYWFEEVMHRVSMDQEVERVLKRFLNLLTSMIPGALDHRRSAVDPIWKSASELYGAFGAKRGMAAGDIVEEFQIVREAVVHMLYDGPPPRFGSALSLPDALRLNRFLDSGVTHASIGHTDGLFFALFEGSGVTTVPPAKLVPELDEQLECIEVEWAAVR